MKNEIGFVALALGAICAPPVIADDIQSKCESMENIRISDVSGLSAALRQSDNDLPEFCEVVGTILPSTMFVVKLPTESWNGKYYQTGCGSFCGELQGDSWGPMAFFLA